MKDEDTEMKIAVTYDNGEVFQHFGKTEYFKVYEVEDNKVVSSEVMSSNGSGHGALAGTFSRTVCCVLFAEALAVELRRLLLRQGIELCAGAQGDTDQAVELT